MKESFKFGLIENAKDSLQHAITHFALMKNSSNKHLKRAILDVVHAVELLLKEKLKRISPALIWSNIDKYPNKDCNTVDIRQAIKRLTNIGGVKFSEKTINTILNAIRIRNDIIHYEFEINSKQTEILVASLLSFIFDFSNRTLKLNLESDLKKDENWKKLINNSEFYNIHSKKIEKQLLKNDIPVCHCSLCASKTFSLTDSKCVFCGHEEKVIECIECQKRILIQEAEPLVDINEDGPFLIGYYCKKCHESKVSEAFDFWVETSSGR